MNVLDRPRASIIIGYSALLWVGLFAWGCGGGAESDAPPDSGAESTLAPEPAPSATPDAGPGSDSPSRPRIVFIGTSLTAGFGLEDPELAYPFVIREFLADAGLDYEVVGAGVSGDTSAGGLARIDWVLSEPASVLFIELGANDGLRGQGTEQLESNLHDIARRARELHPDIGLVIAGMEAPPNLGGAYTEAFRTAFASVAEAHGAALVPFLLDGVAGERELNQSDGIHPSIEGHRILAQNAWTVLEAYLTERCAEDEAC